MSSKLHGVSRLTAFWLQCLQCSAPTTLANQLRNASHSFASSSSCDYSSAPQPASTAQDATFYHSDLNVIRTQNPQPRKSLQDITFGTTFTDHMFLVENSDGRGWDQPTIKPFGFIPVHPAATVLHYGLCCFEGMKAYLGVDGKTRLFRPDLNMARLQRSVQRLQLAEFDGQELLECIKTLLQVDRAWLPAEPGYSIYIRPHVFSSSHSIGVHRPERTTISVLLSPVGPYFKSGLQPIALLLDQHHVRAWKGGVGDFKVGGNYAPTIMPQVAAARQHGAKQVLYTLPNGSDPDDAVVSESGAMNVMFVFRLPDGRRELATPPLDGTILPGVTRDSILSLALARDELVVRERQITVGELKQAVKEGKLLEVFGCGTACIVQPIDVLKLAGGQQDLQIPYDASDNDRLSSGFAQILSDIQYGRTNSPWSVPID